MLPRKGQPVRHTASQAPKSRHRRRLPSGTAPLAHLRPGKKKFRPGNPGRAKFQGWLADCIGRGHKSKAFLILQNYRPCISATKHRHDNKEAGALQSGYNRLPSSRQRRLRTARRKATCPNFTSSGRIRRIMGSATFAL